MDDRVREILVEKLYAQPSGVLIGALAGTLATWGAALPGHRHSLTVSAAILTAKSGEKTKRTRPKS